MKKSFEFIDRVIEGGIYLFVFFMFLTKGEGVRNILIFGNFGLWLLTLRYRKNLNLLKNPVSTLFWLTIGVSVFSVFFSINPLYSFLELRDEPLKSAMLFPVIATVMADEKRLYRASHVMFFTSVLMVLVGYYSYFMHNIPVLKPDTWLMHAWHNKFARYLCTFLPFAFILYFVWKNTILKIFFNVSFVAFIIALILSTSRGGYVAFFSMACVWAVYLSRVRGFNLKKAFINIILSIFVIGALSWSLFPPVRERMSKLPEQLSTINQRTNAWLPAIEAFKEKPLSGWGYGNRIFHQDEPYKETEYKKAPPIGPENTFIKIMFHQGIIGLIPYIVLILVAIREFWRNTTARSGIKDYILVACISVLIGNYILHSMLAVLYMPHLAVILAFGIAATGVNEDSRH